MRARPVFLLIFLISAGALAAGAIYFQAILELLPCPLCVVQRIAFMGVGLFALLAFLHDPRKIGRRIYAGATGLFALAGLVVAARHAWLVRHPEEAFTCSVSPEERFLNSLPLARWWPDMFEAEGDCLEVVWTFLGLGIPDWAVVLFTLLAMLAAATFFARR